MKTFIIIFTVLALTQGAFAQTDDKITDIDKTVLNIKNSLPKGKPCSIGSDDTIQTINRKDDKLVYVSWKRKDIDIVKKDEYYFSNDLLIYYEATWIDQSMNIIKNQKYYISNTHLISWISNEKEIDKTSKEYSDMDNVLSKISNDWEKCKPN
jgi:hypothetical protein